MSDDRGPGIVVDRLVFASLYDGIAATSGACVERRLRYGSVTPGMTRARWRTRQCYFVSPAIRLIVVAMISVPNV